VPATRSPSARRIPPVPSLPAAPGLPGALSGIRPRLVIAFVAIVAIALALVLASLPRLLDGYFARQAAEDLQTRTGVMRLLVATRLFEYVGSGVEVPRPIILQTDPPTVAPGVVDSLDPDAFVRPAQRLVPADVLITIAPDRGRPDDLAYRLFVPLPDEFGAPGQQREDLSSSLTFDIPDLFWTQAGEAAAPNRLVTVELSRPFTYRALTLETIVGLMSVAAILALVVAVVTSIIFADRLTNPLRRLTGAARALSEGELDVRVAAPTGAPEVRELTAAFNAMAERLQGSIEFIRRDRDRSREFLADVSHELRTPIAALRTFNELLAEGTVDETTRSEFLDQSRQQIERLDWLAMNLLELSKLDSGLVLLDLRPDDLRAVVESAVAQAQPSARRRGVEMSTSMPAEPVRQHHDPQRLGQVLANLLSNAVKFTPAGGRVDVELQPTEDGAELVVSDTGVGIDPDELPNVFERFYRGESAHESRAAGSGLGLSIVRSIVEMHNGQVSISSTPGSGTRVVVSLPRDVHEVTVSSPADSRS